MGRYARTEAIRIEENGTIAEINFILLNLPTVPMV